MCSGETNFIFLWRCDPTRVMASSFLRFLHHTQRRTTVGRTSLDEWSVRRMDLYLTTHNIHNRQTSMPGGIRTHDISRQAAADRRLRPRGHWDQHIIMINKALIVANASKVHLCCILKKVQRILQQIFATGQRYWRNTYLLTYSMEQSPSWEANQWTLQIVKNFPALTEPESP
jgi:hypothetical protein